MHPEPCPLELAEALERAYRLALAVDELMGECGTVDTREAMREAVAALLGEVDQARASLMRPPRNSHTTPARDADTAPSASYSPRRPNFRPHP